MWRATLALAAVLAPRPASAEPVAWREPVLYSVAGMSVGLVALVAAGESDDGPSFGNFSRAFGDAPRRDDDPAIYNLVLHPLWGSETYLRAREARMGMLGSFAFSLGASLAWEYLFESWTEHPSSQDLVLTTGLGWMIGELRHRWKRRYPEDAAWADPIHTGVERGMERLGMAVRTSDRRPGLALSWRF